jgi:hypothetical protein
MPKKYELPTFLSGKVTQLVYERWLYRKARAHTIRDRRRGDSSIIGENYRVAIHSAVVESGGLDAYTGEELNWSLISMYDNEKSRIGRRGYKHGFAFLPTVDHAEEASPGAFKICSWRTNGFKGDLEMTELLDLCRAVLEHNGYRVIKGA